MAKYPIKNAKIGIVMEAVATGVTISAQPAQGDDYLGALYANSSTRPYVTLPKPTDVSIDVAPMEETITTVEDDFEHDIHIRAQGSGSCEVLQWLDDAGSGIVDGRHLLYASKNFPRGITSGNSEAAIYSLFSDNGTSKSTDRTGFAVIVQSQYVDSTGATKYLYWVFHNCKIKVSQTIGPQKANRLRIEWRDARYIDGPTKSDTTYGNHSDS